MENTKLIALSAFTEHLFRSNTEYSIYFHSFIEKPVNPNVLKKYFDKSNSG